MVLEMVCLRARNLASLLGMGLRDPPTSASQSPGTVGLQCLPAQFSIGVRVQGE